MSGRSIARRYAKALLTLGLEHASADTFADEIARVAALLHESRELRSAVANPVFPLSQRKQALLAVAERFGLSASVRTFLALLVDRGRIGDLDMIERQYRAMADDAAGRIRAQATSARPLGTDFLAKLNTNLEQVTG